MQQKLLLVSQHLSYIITNKIVIKFKIKISSLKFACPRWAASQAETQFQGSDSSHELAALLLTESVQHALYSTKKPLYDLIVDAKSAFDKILAGFILKNAFLAGFRVQGLLIHRW